MYKRQFPIRIPLRQDAGQQKREDNDTQRVVFQAVHDRLFKFLFVFPQNHRNQACIVGKIKEICYLCYPILIHGYMPRIKEGFKGERAIVLPAFLIEELKQDQMCIRDRYRPRT